MCQPSPLLGSLPSCASCCGIYNYLGHDRRLVTEVLEMQTDALAGWDGTDEHIDLIGKDIQSRRPRTRFEVIYNCPFAGFLDAGRTRVGCLLHPLHLGEDLREHCRYGKRTCGEARCSSYTYLSDEEARAVMAAAGDWYLYGLSINDIDMVKGFFDLCRDSLCGPVRIDRVSAEPGLARAFGRFLALKEGWPLARDPARYGKYYFVEKTYHVYHIDYLALGTSRPLHDGVLLALGSVIENTSELLEGVGLIDSRVENFLEAYQSRVTPNDKAPILP